MRSKIKIKKYCKMQKGITLVVLAVTIVIMLILSGITVATLAGNDGIIETSQSSSNQTIKSEFLKSVQLDILAKKLEKEKNENITMQDIENILIVYYNAGTIEEIWRDADGNITEVKVKDLTEKVSIDEICSGVV